MEQTSHGVMELRFALGVEHGKEINYVAAAKMLDTVHRNTRPCIGAWVIKPNANSFERLAKHLTQALSIMGLLQLKSRKLRVRVDGKKLY